MFSITVLLIAAVRSGLINNEAGKVVGEEEVDGKSNTAKSTKS